MSEYLKRVLQAILVEKRHRLYEERIAAQTVPYGAWLRRTLEQEKAEILAWAENLARKEKAGEGAPEPPAVSVLSREEFCERISDEKSWEGLGELWIVTSNPDALVPEAVWEVRRYFEEHPDCAIAYGDEDRYLKPGWSPDLLQSFFYFGNIIAVRRTLLEKAVPKSRERRRGLPRECAEAEAFYDIVLCCVDEAKEAGHIEKILFLSREISESEKGFPEDSEIPANYRDWGREPAFDRIKQGHRYSGVEIPKEREEQDLVSVVILSKDNPAVLSKCIHSLWERTDYGRIEIIVVDNGSSDENRARISWIREQMREEYDFRYLYRPMEFNFSALCNLGAAEAGGKYLLFLNDDIEIAEENWLKAMLSKAGREDVGAVGAKLLYPNSDRIQHAGVINIHLGPAHKLQFSSDREEYYHGYNRCAVNVSAVTGACLLVRKEVFEEVGGFPEYLRVALNDVELCFRLLRAGYRNVCCNDTFLYHHESLSRGYDAGLEKVERLHRERDILYEAYPEMWNRDDWYSGKLVTDILDRGFEPACRFEERQASRRARAERIGSDELNPAWLNACLYMGLEFTGDEKAWRTGTPGGGDYYIQGWSYALHVDNSRYKKSLLLKPMGGSEGGKDGLWRISYEDCYRPDFQENLSDIDHPALCGVSIWLDRDALPAGKYLIGFLWEDTCSRQKLYGFTAETLVVREGAEADTRHRHEG